MHGGVRSTSTARCGRSQPSGRRCVARTASRSRQQPSPYSKKHERYPHPNDLVFPSRQGQVIHHSTIALALRTAGLDTTQHGFKATFRPWALENGADWAASELALAHELGNAVTQAYARVRHARPTPRTDGALGPASHHPSDRRRLIHAPAGPGKPQPLKDPPMGHEDLARESTGSDVFQPASQRVPPTPQRRRAPHRRRRQGPRPTQVEALP